MDSISSDVILLETACIEITYPVKPPSSFVLELLICLDVLNIQKFQSTNACFATI